MKSNNPVRLGVIGTGFVAAQHLPGILDRHGDTAQLVGAYSGRKSWGGGGNLNLGSADKPMPEHRWFETPSALIEDPEIDAVMICSPGNTHVDLTLQAFAAGKHVFCEKPMTIDPQDLTRLLTEIRRAEGSGLTFVPGMVLHCWMEFAILIDAIRTGVLTDGSTSVSPGKLLQAEFRHTAPPPNWGQSHFLDPQKSGGGLVDFGTHMFGLMPFLADLHNDATLSAFGRTGPSGTYDYANYRIAKDDGTLLQVSSGWHGFGFELEFKVSFEKGILRYRFASPAEPMTFQGTDGKVTQFKLDPRGCYFNQVTRWLDSLATGKSYGIVTATDAANAVRLGELARLSIIRDQACFTIEGLE